MLGYFLDSVRAGWAGRTLDRLPSQRALPSCLQHGAANPERSNTDSLRDIATLRTFLGSNGVLGLFDAPWLPLYLHDGVGRFFSLTNVENPLIQEQRGDATLSAGIGKGRTADWIAGSRP